MVPRPEFESVYMTWGSHPTASFPSSVEWKVSLRFRAWGEKAEAGQEDL